MVLSSWEIWAVYFKSSVQLEMPSFTTYTWKYWSCLLNINTFLLFYWVFIDKAIASEYGPQLLMDLSAWRDSAAVKNLLSALSCFFVALVPENVAQAALDNDSPQLLWQPHGAGFHNCTKQAVVCSKMLCDCMCVESVLGLWTAKVV